ncbi:MAG: LamG-like jellyroll fold domain-containing protein [Chloroflexota bacterium]
MGGASAPGGSTGLFDLNITPPATVGQYTLRLDLVYRDAQQREVYVSDGATPSLFYSRAKHALTADDTRWTGDSMMEREEFSIAVTNGAGTAAGSVESITLGNGDRLALNLAAPNVRYSGDAGVGFADLVPVALAYGYDSANADGCVTKSVVLKACGWYTNWDERIVRRSDTTFDYFDASGSRYFGSVDGSEQLVSGAPVLIERPRTTWVDENAITSWTTGREATATTTAYTGSWAYRFDGDATAYAQTTSGAPDVSLNQYRYVDFALRTSSNSGVAIVFLAKNGATGTTYNVAYTVGTSFTVPGADSTDSVTTSTPVDTWRSPSTHIDLLAEVQSHTSWGAWPDPWTVTGFQVYGNGGSGYYYVDSVYFEGRQSGLYGDAQPAWTTGAGTIATTYTADVYSGTSALKVVPATWGTTATCSDCNGARGTEYPYVAWAWKKYGGQTASISFQVQRYQKNDDGDWVGSGTASTWPWITYYAGPRPPENAPNAIQVADEVPTEWTVVRRNLAADAGQILNWYNDDPAGKTSNAPAPPTADPLVLRGWKVLVRDGFLLLDEVRPVSLPDVGNGAFGANEYDQPQVSVNGVTVPAYDFVITNPDLSRHYFSRDGQLLRIDTRDRQTLALDWTRIALTTAGPADWELDRIRAATDGTKDAASVQTYDRELDVSASGTAPRVVTFTEHLGSMPGNALTGRSAAFYIDNVATAADVTRISTGRDGGSCEATSNSADGCLHFTYTGTTHRLASASDPTWSGAPGASQRWWDVGWTGTTPTSIGRRTGGATTATPLLTVLTRDASNGVATYRQAVVQTQAMRSAQGGPAVQYRELNPDGTERVIYEPQTCTGGCPTLPGINLNQKLVVRQFDGLARINTTTRYRVNGTSPQITVERRASRSGAKIDNFNDPLTAGLTAWTQSSDQFFASMKDSGGSSPDLYRTEFTYDGFGGTVTSARTVPSPKLDIPAFVRGVAPGLAGYWRLGEASGSAADSSQAATLHPGTYVSAVLGQPGVLVGDGNTAAKFSGTSSYMEVGGWTTSPGSTYSIGAWVKLDSIASSGALFSTRSPGEYGFEVSFIKDVGLRATIGDGSAWIWTNDDVRYSFEASRWYHVLYVVRPGRYTVYLDGVPLASRTALSGTPLLTDANHALRIGNGRTGNLSGTVDEVMLWATSIPDDAPARVFAAGHRSARIVTRTLFDRLGRPVEVSDQFLANPGFESGTTGWTLSNPAPTIGTGGDQGASALLVGGGQTASTWVQLTPGQTTRLQAYVKAPIGSTARVEAAASATSGGWTDLNLPQPVYDGAGAAAAWDIVLPLDGTDGRLQITLKNTGSGTVTFDSLAVFTTWAKTTYTSTAGANPDRFAGLPKSVRTLPLNPSGSMLEAETRYAETVRHPAIFVTTAIVNKGDGARSDADAADVDGITDMVYDAWGRPTSVTDPDGVVTTSAYANMTDLTSTTNAVDDTTGYEYDVAGHPTANILPSGGRTSTTYDIFGHPDQETAADGVVTRHTGDVDAAGIFAVGYEDRVVANEVPGSPGGAASPDNIATFQARDALGRVVETMVDGGGPAATRATAAFDLLGNTTVSTQFEGVNGSGASRTTTSSFEAISTTFEGSDVTLVRSAPTGTKLPIEPGASAPDCPAAGGGKCNEVQVLDAAGRVVRIYDAYGHETRIEYDLAGKPLRTITNYADGVPSAGESDTDLLTSVTYTISGLPVATIDPAGLKTVAEYDNLGRATRINSYDKDASAVYASRTVYTHSGKTLMASGPDAPSRTDVQRAWTRTVYDIAGRATRTLENVDWSGTQSMIVDNFEDRDIGARELLARDRLVWSPDATGALTGGATATAADPDFHAVPARTGRGRLRVTTTATANQGVSLMLPDTLIGGATYTARIHVRTDGGAVPTLAVQFANDAGTLVGTPGSSGTVGPAYVDLTASWPVPAGGATGVRLLIRNTDAVASTWFVDDVTIWNATQWADASFTGSRALGIPVSETVYDAAGRVAETIAAPGIPGDAGMVTGSAYDPAGRGTIVTANESRGYAAALASGSPSSVVAYWPLDDLGGAVRDLAAARDGSVTGRVGRGVAGGVDEARTAYRFGDGAGGYATVPYNKSTWGLATATSLSMEAWFRTGATTGKRTIVRNSHYGLGFWLALNGSALEAVVYTSAGQAIVTTPATSFTDNRWHHIVGAYDGASLHLYLDGVDKGSYARIGSLNTWDDFVAIGALDTGSEPWAGDLDEVALYRVGLTSTAVQAHYTKGRASDDATNLTSRTAYDALGRATQSWDPLGRETRHEYDRLGRTTRTVQNYANGTPTDATGAASDDDVTSTFAYNALGELLAYCPARNVLADECDPTSATTTSLAYRSGWHWAYDALGRTVRQAPPIVSETGGAGNLAVREWVYDAGGLLAATRDVWDGFGTAGNVCAGQDSAYRYSATPVSAYDQTGRLKVARTYDCATGTAVEKVRTEVSYGLFGPTATASYLDGSSTAADTLTQSYDPAGRENQIVRTPGNLVLSDLDWNARGLASGRTDYDKNGAMMSGYAFGYDYAGRQLSIATGSGTDLLGGTARWSYRLDGLLAGRTWPGTTPAASVSYDGAKRPTALTVGTVASFTKNYDRAGNTLTEGRTIRAAGSGTNGSINQVFTYDKLDRLLSAAFEGSAAQTYEYDLDGNRVKAGSGTFHFTRADQLLDGPNGTFAYDHYGNLSTNRESGTDTVTYGYDLADRLTAITVGGTTATITLDAYGRMRTRAVAGGSTTTYSYVAGSETVTSIDDSSASGVDLASVVTASGDRILAKQTAPTTATGWLLPDLHGNVAAAMSTAGSITAAIRYDGFGQVVGTPYAAGAPSMAWRYQGRLDVQAGITTSAPALYDMSARNYSPGLGAFTSLDSVMGSAQDPRSMNRYLYAAANPWTMVDPTGHAGCPSNGAKCPNSNGSKVVVVGEDGKAQVISTSTTGGGDSTKPDEPVIKLPGSWCDPSVTFVALSSTDSSLVVFNTQTHQACAFGHVGDPKYCVTFNANGMSLADEVWRDPATGLYYTELGVDSLNGAELDDWVLSIAIGLMIAAPTVLLAAATEEASTGRLDDDIQLLSAGATGSQAVQRSLNLFPTTPGWGMTLAHLEKHFTGLGALSLRGIDPGGSMSQWMSYIRELAGREATVTRADGVQEIIGQFPRADGNGTFTLGIRILSAANGTFDLITVLTKQ